MKTNHSLSAIVIICMIAAVTGCAASPEDRWYQQRETLNTANRIYLAHTPVMTDEQVVYYGELLQTARAQLDEAKAHLPKGGPTFDTTLDVVESILARVIALEAQAAPATPPAPEDTFNDTR